MNLFQPITDKTREKYYKQKIQQDLAMPFHPTILGRLKENLRVLRNLGTASQAEISQLETEIDNFGDSR